MPSQGETETTACAAARIDGMRCLIVEDDDDSREMLAQFLQRRGASVVTASSALEALTTLPTFRPHVIVSDIGMPLIDGYDFMRRVRELPGDAGGRTPAIALTAFVTAADARAALDAGFQRHLPKPVASGTLVQAIIGVCNAVT